LADAGRVLADAGGEDQRVEAVALDGLDATALATR